MKTLLLMSALVTQVSFAATYSVPVTADLAEHAAWPLAKNAAHATLTGDQLEVSYGLPLSLVGKPSGYEFTGTVENGFAEVSGDGVHGICMLAGDVRLSCMLKYPRLHINPEVADKELAKTFSGEALLSRSRVIRLFGNDPAGILQVDIE